MSGCIDWFKSRWPNIRKIVTVSGTKLDTVYERTIRDGGLPGSWEAKQYMDVPPDIARCFPPEFKLQTETMFT
jgi:hypothetical protein